MSKDPENTYPLFPEAADRLRAAWEARKRDPELRLTLADLAAMCGVKASSVSDVLNANVQSTKCLRQLARSLEIPFYELLRLPVDAARILSALDAISDIAPTEAHRLVNEWSSHASDVLGRLKSTKKAAQVVPKQAPSAKRPLAVGSVEVQPHRTTKNR